jgi:hypothetical protein
MYREHAQQTLSSVADLKVNSLLEWRFDRIQDAEYIQNQLELSNLSLSETKTLTNVDFQEKVIDRITQLQSISQYEVLILDTNGKQIFSFPKNVTPISNIPKSLLEKALMTKKITFIDLHRNSFNQKIYLGYLIPLLDKNAQDKIYGIV